MADFYGTVAGFKAYWTARGDAVALATADGDILIALLIASEWLDAAFRSQFAGLKSGGRAQIREWPRSAVTDIYGYSVASDVPPREIENATYEATLRQLKTPGIFFRDYSPSKYRNVSITGALSVEFAVGSAFEFQTQMPAIAAILVPILTSNASFSSLSGDLIRV